MEKTNIKIREIKNYKKDKQSFETNKANDEINNSFEDEFEELKDELKIDSDTTHFIYLYYLNKPKYLLLELIKLYPELIYFKSNNFDIKDYIKELRKI